MGPACVFAPTNNVGFGGVETPPWPPEKVPFDF